MRNLLPVLASSLLLAAPAFAENPPPAAPKPAAPAASTAPATPPASTAQPITAHAAETLKKKPSRDLQNSIRSWELEGTDAVNVRLHEITGTVPLHLHADTQERVFLVEGKVLMTIGDKKVTLAPGDYVSIPPGVPHKVELPKGVKRALAAGFMIPPPDPKQTTWLEPAPKPANAK
ncbi:MAG TPA: cupin domain-containing protein [Myxococcaceae bacterium]|nr:cupin domain-containing protein [Myxococcaceae bacterium]